MSYRYSYSAEHLNPLLFISDMIQGKCINNYLGVRFDSKHNKVMGVGLNGIEIIRPDEWLHRAGDEGETSTNKENVNYLETRPQICTVTVANDNYHYKVGDKLFVHYMAWETAQCGDITTFDAIIKTDFIFFTILPDGTYKMDEEVYIGKQLYTEEEVRPSGIIVSQGRPKVSHIRITHIPKNPPKNYGQHPVLVGDEVVSIDPYDYQFNLDGEKWVKLKWSEIAGKMVGARVELLAS